jgi:hypothetical protein
MQIPAKRNASAAISVNAGTTANVKTANATKAAAKKPTAANVETNVNAAITASVKIANAKKAVRSNCSPR